MIDVLVDAWEIECCREPPFVGQAWSVRVLLAGDAAIRRDKPLPIIERNDDGTFTIVGVVVQRLGGHRDRAVVLETPWLRVVLRRDAEVGATYEASGTLVEDRHPTYVRAEDGELEASCVGNVGTIRKIVVVPSVREQVGGVEYTVPGQLPGDEVESVERWGLDDATIHLTVDIREVNSTVEEQP
jgi:hypothetical protein